MTPAPGERRRRFALVLATTALLVLAVPAGWPAPARLALGCFGLALAVGCLALEWAVWHAARVRELPPEEDDE
jgi:hypothetical protein